MKYAVCVGIIVDISQIFELLGYIHESDELNRLHSEFKDCDGTCYCNQCECESECTDDCTRGDCKCTGEEECECYVDRVTETKFDIEQYTIKNKLAITVKAVPHDIIDENGQDFKMLDPMFVGLVICEYDTGSRKGYKCDPSRVFESLLKFEPSGELHWLASIMDPQVYIMGDQCECCR